VSTDDGVEVDPALANQIACASRAIGLALHEVMRASSVVAANNEAREYDDVAQDEMQQAIAAAQSLLVDFVRFNPTLVLNILVLLLLLLLLLCCCCYCYCCFPF
jgi:hypothetical protein